MTIQHGCLRNGIFSGGKQRLLACACSGRLLILVVSLSELILLSVLMIISTPKHTTHKLLMYMNEVMACMDNLSNAQLVAVLNKSGIREAYIWAPGHVTESQERLVSRQDGFTTSSWPSLAWNESMLSILSYKSGG